MDIASSYRSRREDDAPFGEGQSGSVHIERRITAEDLCFVPFLFRFEPAGYCLRHGIAGETRLNKQDLCLNCQEANGKRIEVRNWPQGLLENDSKDTFGRKSGYLYISLRERKRENRVNVSNSSLLSVHCHWEKVQDTCLLLPTLASVGADRVDWLRGP